MNYNIEAEQSLLGMLLINNRVFEKISETLKQEHFYEMRHAKIYQVCSDLILSGRVADPITLKRFFNDDNALDEIGGQKYLVQLSNTSITSRTAEEYSKLIYDLSLKRELNFVLNEKIKLLNDSENNAKDILEDVEQTLFQISTDDVSDKGFKSFEDNLKSALLEYEESYKAAGKFTGVTSGLIDVDKRLGGFKDSDLIILAGRPAMGKTALGVNIAFEAARHGKSVGFYSLEMSDTQLASRILASHAGVDVGKSRTGGLTKEDMSDLAGAKREISSLPIHIDATPALSVAVMRTRARRLQRQKGLDMLIIDYLGLAKSNGNHRSKVHDIEEITSGLKCLAKELNIPVLVLSQLSRGVESRDDKRPVLSDLRDSGAIEQDADIVLMLYRAEYYLERELNSPQGLNETGEKYEARRMKADGLYESSKNQAELNIVKNRHGSTGSIDLHFNASRLKFGNMERDNQWQNISEQ